MHNKKFLIKENLNFFGLIMVENFIINDLLEKNNIKLY